MSSNNPDFDNGAYWDRRYTDNPSLGSGIGSRGDNALHKRTIVERLIQAIEPKTILDVGCGDHEVLGEFAYLPGYTGIDISNVVIDANSKRFIDRKFECMDFASLHDERRMRADLVLCLEVLIHQHRRNEYECLVENVIACADKAGLVSAYIVDPRAALSSDIIAWHEPITDTLYRAGAKSVIVEGRSLESDCLVFVSFRV